MIQILVADSINEAGLQPLLKMKDAVIIQKKVTDPYVILDEIDALLVRSATKVTEDLLMKMPNLKIIGRAGVGVDNIDVQAATRRGIMVINAPDGNTISTAEHTFAMMAALMRNIPQAYESLKNLQWNRSQFVGTELFGKNLGIIGMGRIGAEIAKRARAFGLNVYVFDPFLTTIRAKDYGIKNCSLDEVLEIADIITVHTPLTPDTKGLLNETTLAKTKKGVYLLNCARGGIIEEKALEIFIGNGHVAGAALDVFIKEPPGEHPLFKFGNVIFTPHLGASTKEAQLNVAVHVSKEVRDFLEGKPVSNAINLPFMTKDVFQKIQPFNRLGKRMGSIISQIMNEGIDEISVTYAGTVNDLEITYITKAIISGFLKNQVGTSVNEINALLMAKERGITIGEKLGTNTFGYANSITVTVKGANRSFMVRGTYIDHYGPRIVNLNGFNLDFLPEGELLMIRHIDRPGVIGRVGKIVGDHEVNIAAMQVGRKAAGGEAIMVLSSDKPVTNDLLQNLTENGDITSAIRIYL